MNDIIDYIQRQPMRGRGRGRIARGSQQALTQNTVYVICNDLGSIMLVTVQGRLIRKANVEGHMDIDLVRSISTINEMIRTSQSVITIHLKQDSVVSMMYCHRTCHEVRAPACQKIYLLGPACFAFNDFQQEVDSPITTSLENQDRLDPINAGQSIQFDLKDRDEFEIYGSHFRIRASGNKHCFYVKPEQVYENIRFLSPDTDALQSFIDELTSPRSRHGLNAKKSFQTFTAKDSLTF